MEKSSSAVRVIESASLHRKVHCTLSMEPLCTLSMEPLCSPATLKRHRHVVRPSIEQKANLAEAFSHHRRCGGKVTASKPDQLL